jgi:hypothetical protein
VLTACGAPNCRGRHDPDDLPVEASTDYGQFAMAPELLINFRVSDVAIRLYAVLALHVDRKSSTTLISTTQMPRSL